MKWLGKICVLGLLISPGWAEEAGQKLSCEGEWVLAVDVSSDGKRLVSGGDKGVVRVWDLEKRPVVGVELVRFESPVTALVFGPEEKSVLLGTWDGELVSCDVKTGKVLRRYEEHEETITALNYDRSGKFFGSGSADDRLIIWDAESGEDLLMMHQGNEYDVTTLAFSPDGETVATGDGENQLRLWDATNGEAIRNLEGHEEPVSCVVYDAKGRLISGSWDDVIRVWDEEGVRRMEGHEGDITALSVSGDGKRLFSSSEDRTVRVWDLESGESVRVLKGAGESLRCLSVSADGKVVVAGTKGEIVCWGLE